MLSLGLTLSTFAAGGKAKDPNGVAPNRYVYYPGTEPLDKEDIRVVCLGSGLPAARRGQAATCFLIECGNGEKYIFDIGTGSMANTAALMIPYDFLDKVFISHLHTDHIGDLPTLWAGGWTAGRTGNLRVWGPSGATKEMGTKYAIENMLKFLNWDYQTRAYKINTKPGQIEINEFDYKGVNQIVFQDKGVTIRSFPAVHIGDGPVSYSLEFAGKKVVFGGDSVPNKWFIKYAKHADLVIHEAMPTPEQLVKYYNQPPQLAWRASAQFHTSPAAFGKLMSKVQPKQAVMYHFFNEEGTRYDAYQYARATYGGPISMCTDLMVWDLKGDTITERMAVITDDAWSVPGPNILPPPDSKSPNPMTKFIQDGTATSVMIESQEELLKKFWKKYDVKIDEKTKKMYKVK